jgi:hypothetical protein
MPNRQVPYQFRIFDKSSKSKSLYFVFNSSYLYFMDSTQLHENWFELINALELILGKRPSDLNAVLFMIGVQELGLGAKEFSKEEKQDLMHIATCELLSFDGFYQFSHRDEQNWPHYDLIKPVPKEVIKFQVRLLRKNALIYFRKQGVI